MQTNLSYILLFCSFFFIKTSFSQDIKSKEKTIIALPKKDTIFLKKKDSLYSSKKDSLLLRNKDTVSIDSIKPKESVEDIITHVAKDYKIQNARDKTVTLYNEANIKYTDIDLKAGIIIIDYKKNTLFAKGIKDSTGYAQRPIFKQGNEESEQDSMIYNFKSKRAIIYGLKTKQGEMYTYGKKTKRVNDSTVYIRKIRFTTSDKKNPDYYISTDKAKLVPGKKIIVGISNLVLADVPTPLFLPFAYFPMTETSVSGFLIPSFDTGSSSRGIGFQNGGYYFALSDYADLTVLGDVYSNGSWGSRISSNYKKRYHFNGAFSFNFENIIKGIRGFDNYSKANNFNIRWSHSQDSKASPNSRFTASVNLGSSSFFRESLNQFNVAQTQNNTFNSSINYSKTFVDTPFNMAVTASHQQNTNTETITMTLPSLTLNMNRVYPFAGKGGVKKNPIQKLGFNYNMQGQYLINTTDDEFFTSKMFETARSGMQHRTSTSTNIKAFKYFTLSPTANYEETWQFDYINKEYDITDNVIVTDTLRGFKTYREYNMGVSLSTNIYGTFNFNKGRLKAIRHTFRPTVSYSYRPDFKDKYIKEVQQSALASDLKQYTIFDQGIYGSPSAGLSNSIGISLNNVLEAKVAPKDPDSDEEDEKIMLLNNLNFNSSYNIAADSLRWSNVSFSAGTRLLNDKLALNFNGSLDPYQVNDEGRRIDKFNPNIFRLTNANLTANYSISSTDFDKNKEDGKDNDDRQNGNGANNPPDVMGANIDPTNRRGVQNTQTKSKTSKTDLYKAKIPWSVNLVYSANYRNNGVEPGEIGVHTLGFSGNIELSPKWKVGYSSGYDVKSGAFSFSRFNFTRDLDSWQFNFNWVPFGRNSSYTFFIGVKSSTLADLKWDKNKPPDRRLF
ncbi:LPS assembly outer membrane protein LptD (organic solvent tolerance protein OstA) [Polaribacter sp. Hel1_33_78]|uniref:putative LPS assembly protein LptD n=1 Tax=Polaribacter sp. Hel1_33_78 TaxID=1336804 RepID=UPI000879B074|nr:putative LPS assembly protein LptD [Polaribacter sp. Hel1_33_78]SDU03559.1 LPS assembly outer membrane protein LptD (organic solvent tolerance protein OstA) [Polaribacter sp. Hel1_33_78]